MRRLTVASVTALSLALVAGSFAVTGFDTVALAKGGGNGGGNGHGNGNGNSSGDGSGGQHSQNDDPGQGSVHSQRAARDDGPLSKSANAEKEKRARDSRAELAGLNSLKRNYRAYMTSSDPRMTAISAYAVAYARYEINTGTEPSPLDPKLGDEALGKALASTTKTGTVSPAALSEAKAILGVGSAKGKIDQIRDAMEANSSASIDQ